MSAVQPALDIWNACAGAIRPGPLQGAVLRLVESQEEVATGRLVRSLAGQAALEAMLEASKPPLPESTRGLHYLLATPFRYPPLPHGSRFGTRFEPGIFYGSRTLPPVLAEAAYYRFVFWSGMEQPPAGRLLTQHSLFRARFRTVHGLALQAPPFDRFRDQLRDPARYEVTQRLGVRLREAGIEGIEYESARDPAAGLNLALFDPRALIRARTLRQDAWLCATSADLISFRRRQGGDVREFPLALFLVAGELPAPAL